MNDGGPLTLAAMLLAVYALGVHHRTLWVQFVHDIGVIDHVESPVYTVAVFDDMRMFQNESFRPLASAAHEQHPEYIRVHRSECIGRMGKPH
jgi:hypothetical protein